MITPTAVYLMKNDWSQSNYKIGVSNRPARREIEVQENYGVYTILLASCWFPTKQDALKAEQKWHKIFEHFRTDDHSGKEWFSLPSSRVEQFLNWAKPSSDEGAMKRLFFKYGSSTDEVRGLLKQLFRSFPQERLHRTIDVWHSNYYML
jgi:predicted GIY-YIG superfamily endonuclease